jgi:hypothetical protein
MPSGPKKKTRTRSRQNEKLKAELSDLLEAYFVLEKDLAVMTHLNNDFTTEIRRLQSLLSAYTSPETFKVLIGAEEALPN